MKSLPFQIHSGQTETFWTTPDLHGPGFAHVRVADRTRPAAALPRSRAAKPDHTLISFNVIGTWCGGSTTTPRRPERGQFQLSCAPGNFAPKAGDRDLCHDQVSLGKQLDGVKHWPDVL